MSISQSHELKIIWTLFIALCGYYSSKEILLPDLIKNFIFIEGFLNETFTFIASLLQDLTLFHISTDFIEK